MMNEVIAKFPFLEIVVSNSMKVGLCSEKSI